MTAAITLDPPETPHEATARVAAGVASFKNKEFIKIPVLTRFVKEMDVLRQAGALLGPGVLQDGMCVCLPAGVGKSTAARMLQASVAARAGVPVSESSVLLVELDVEESISLWSSILKALGDPYYDVGYPRNLKKRAFKLLRKRGIDLIIIDEFNHAVDRGQARLIMNTIKEVLNAGLAPVVVMGTDEEIERLPRIKAFERRMVHHSPVGPLDWTAHAEDWRGFLQGLDRAITTLDILPSKSNLGSPKLAEALCEACGGVIGYAHWVVQDALTRVLTRRGTSIDRLDLAVSVNHLYVKESLFGQVNAVEALA
jgi:hypothetical protein